MMCMVYVTGWGGGGFRCVCVCVCVHTYITCNVCVCVITNVCICEQIMETSYMIQQTWRYMYPNLTDGYKDTKIQGYKDTRIQGYKDTRIQVKLITMSIAIVPNYIVDSKFILTQVWCGHILFYTVSTVYTGRDRMCHNRMYLYRMFHYRMCHKKIYTANLLNKWTLLGPYICYECWIWVGEQEHSINEQLSRWVDR